MSDPTPEQLEMQRRNREWMRRAKAARPRLLRRAFDVAGRLNVTDPCYDTDVWCAIFGLAAKPGRWLGFVTETESGPFGERIESLVAYHEDHASQAHGSTGWESIGDVGVDSGQAGVFAAERYEHDDEADATKTDNFYGRCCAITTCKPYHGCIEEGYVSSSGLGDGVYPAEALRVGHAAVAVRIRFL